DEPGPQDHELAEVQLLRRQWRRVRRGCQHPRRDPRLEEPDRPSPERGRQRAGDRGEGGALRSLSAHDEGPITTYGGRPLVISGGSAGYLGPSVRDRRSVRLCALT